VVVWLLRGGFFVVCDTDGRKKEGGEGSGRPSLIHCCLWRGVAFLNSLCLTCMYCCLAVSVCLARHPPTPPTTQRLLCIVRPPTLPVSRPSYIFVCLCARVYHDLIACIRTLSSHLALSVCVWIRCVTQT